MIFLESDRNKTRCNVKEVRNRIMYIFKKKSNATILWLIARIIVGLLPLIWNWIKTVLKNINAKTSFELLCT